MEASVFPHGVVISGFAHTPHNLAGPKSDGTYLRTEHDFNGMPVYQGAGRYLCWNSQQGCWWVQKRLQDDDHGFRASTQGDGGAPPWAVGTTWGPDNPDVVVRVLSEDGEAAPPPPARGLAGYHATRKA